MDQQVPTGFRFYPTEEELISFYLHNKLNNTRPDIHRVIPVLDIYDYDPSHLPQFGGDYCPAEGEQWFFFIPRPEREARGGRPNRLTTEGYWKATGSPVNVYSSQNHVIGRKRTMVFYVGRAPSGRKTAWKMNEYKAVQPSFSSIATDPTAANPHLLREEISLCRIYKRSKCLRTFDRRPGVQQQLCQNYQHTSMEDAEAAACMMQISDDGNEVAIPDIGREDHCDVSPLDWEQLKWLDGQLCSPIQDPLILDFSLTDQSQHL